MLNPLDWKAEHRAGLVAAIVAGAALGVAVGYLKAGRSRFTYWLDEYAGDAFIWAFIGALVIGAAVYCYRVSSQGR